MALGNGRTTLKSLVLLLLLTSCGTFLFPKKETPRRQLSKIERLENKYDRYTELGRDSVDGDGFVATDRCDSLLFSSLSGLARPGGINLEAAERSPGEWLRRPASYPECWESGESRSTISKDMLIGVIYYYYFTGLRSEEDREKSLDKLLEMMYYGRSNSWFMGRGRNLGLDTFVGPVERSLLGRAVEALGGGKMPEAENPLIYQPCSDDPFYGTDCHLTLLYIYLGAELRGEEVTADELLIIEGAVERSPGNPFFQAVLGKYRPESRGIEKAIDILLDDKIWPSTRLPTSTDRCENWLIRRYDDDAPAYRDCSDQGRNHTGEDLLFTTWLIRKDI